jgi:acyl CoA:acetate/3-ketoacid CoA transferase
VRRRARRGAQDDLGGTFEDDLRRLALDLADDEARGVAADPERALFRATADGLELSEIAPGIDIERDILAHMDFKPAIAADVKLMDARLFSPRLMGLADDAKQRRRAGA